MNPLWQLTLARFREFIREPAAVFWVYVFPLVMVVSLGTAFRNKPVEEIAVDVVESARTSQISEALRADGRFRVTIGSSDEAAQRLRTGKTELVIAPDETDVSRVAYRYSFDPTRPGSVLARNTADDIVQRASGREDVVETADVEISEPGSRYIDFLIPGMIGMGLMGGGLWGVGFAIVDLRIRKLLKRFVATPMKRTHFLGAMMISRLVFMLPEVLVICLFARFFFGVENHGSWLTVGILIVAGAFQFAGVGLLVACRAKTLETVSGLMNLVMIPMWIGSGIFFSTERFPDIVQPLIQLLPLTPLIAALREVMQEGATLTDVGIEFAVILVWGLATFGVALKLFRWQ